MKKMVRTRLIEARKRQQWSQQTLADHIGTTRINISRWEAGLTAPGPYFRTKLCELFKMSAHELGLFGSDPASDESKTKAGESTGELSAETLALWTVPYLRNPHFTGREELLDVLDQQFSVAGDNRPTPLRQAALTQPQAIKGLGGIGKTQIAVEYAYRASEQGRYAHILWINAASEEAIITSFVALSELIPAVAVSKETDQRKMVMAIIRWLEQCKERWLLIFDNADEVSLLVPYLPHQGNGSLLFTTRAYAVGAFAASIDVEKMGLVEGTMLLLHRAQRQHASDEERNEASNIVIALDGFPLALDQAGAYIEETGCSFGDYLQTYQQHHQILLARRGRQGTNYPDSVATTWSLSFARIEQTNAAAAALLHLCAFLAPDAIPEKLFTAGAAQWPAVLQQAVADRFAFNQLLEALLSFSLIKRRVEERVLSLHRLVQVVQRDAMGQEEQQQWAERVVRAVHVVFPRDPKEDVASWPQCLRYLEQAQACDELIQQYQFSFLEAAELLDRTGIYLTEHASYALAEPLYQRSARIREELLGPEHPLVATSLNNLAILYNGQGRYAEAEPLYQQALRILEQHEGSEHHLMASPLNGLAGIYHKLGRYAEAEPLYQQALRILEQHEGSEHHLMASPLNNLAIIYFDQGRYAEAEPLYQQALRIFEKYEGPEHLLVAYPLTGLANLYNEQGRYAEAASLYQRAMRIWEQQVGPEHPLVTSPLTGLAILYLKQRRYEDAEPLYQRAVRIWEQQVGPEHLQVAYPLTGLANLYNEQGRYSEAEPLYRRVVRIFERMGPEHPQMAQALAGLANLYRNLGRYAEAEPLYQEALHIQEQQVGLQHSETAEILHDFAIFKEVQGEYQEAMSLYQRALAVREQILGAEHPTTIATRTRYLACEGRALNEKLNSGNVTGSL